MECPPAKAKRPLKMAKITTKTEKPSIIIDVRDAASDSTNEQERQGQG